MAEEKQTSFEEDLARLEWITDQLDEGEQPLDESIALFEEGRKLLARCRKTLEEAQVKVRRLMENGELRDMDPDSLGR